VLDSLARHSFAAILLAVVIEELGLPLPIREPELLFSLGFCPLNLVIEEQSTDKERKDCGSKRAGEHVEQVVLDCGRRIIEFQDDVQRQTEHDQCYAYHEGDPESPR
jgi:hypothetical protein